MKFVDGPAEAVHPAYDHRPRRWKTKVQPPIQDGIAVVEFMVEGDTRDNRTSLAGPIFTAKRRISRHHARDGRCQGRLQKRPSRTQTTVVHMSSEILQLALSGTATSQRLDSEST